MKGVLQLTVEVDYSKIIKKENLEALYDFTGIKDEQELIKVHLSNLGKEIEGVVRNLPHTVYNLQGNVMLDNEEEMENIQKYHKVEEDRDTQEESKSVSSASEDALMYSELLDAKLNHVSTNLGIPVEIKVNEAMYKLITEKYLKDNNEADIESDFDTYMGFPMTIDAMEEHFLIKYKSYTSNEMKYVSHVDEKVNTL